MGHVKMMGAVQPFISGAISKTVNLPEQTTIDEIAKLLRRVAAVGVKAIAIYRDNCKVAQPLSGSGWTRRRRCSWSARRASCPSAAAATSTTRPRSAASSRSATTRGTSTSACSRTGRRRHLRHREGGHDLAGLMNSFMISVSLGLQYGVPLEVYVSKFSHMRFEPSGLTNARRSASRSRSSTTSSAGWARSSSPPTSRRRPAS